MGANIVSKYAFMPPLPTYDEKKPFKVTYITTKSGKKIPSYHLVRKNTKTTILYSHGNAADIGGMFEFLALLYENLPVNVFHYEYLGYGLAMDYGPPTEDTTYESAEAAYDYLIKTVGLKPEDILIFGTSVGSGPSCHLASKYKGLKGLVLEAPFLSCCRVVTKTPLLRPIDIFVNYDKIGKVTSPVFILHGSIDEVIEQEHGRVLYSNIPEKFKYTPQWIEGANHHDIIEIMGIKNYLVSINNFINYCSKFNSGKTLKESDKGIEINLKEVELKVDSSKKSTKIQFQLINGKTIQGEFNVDQTVNDLYDYVSKSTSVSIEKFELLQLPKNKLTNMDETLEDGDLVGVKLIQQEKK